MTYVVATFWTPLATTPLLWLAVTLAAYVLGLRLQRVCRSSSLVSPVVIAIALVVMILLATHTPYPTYFAGAQFINLLLGPATTALAIPLAKNFDLICRQLRGVGLALLAGSVTSIVSGVGVVWILGGSRDVALSMAPKAVTTPIAMAVSQQIGGIPALTAAFAILGGVVAAALGQQILRSLHVNDWRTHGLAAGVAGSGIAAAHVASRDESGAAFAAVGIGLNGLLTAILVPFLIFCLR